MNLQIKAVLLITSFYLFFSSLCFSQEDLKQGEHLYKMNCMACHHLKNLVVGPSLVEIAHIYKGKPTELVKWSMNPGQKRKGGLRMPPMSHIGEKGLNDIAAYIFKTTKGMAFKGNKVQTDPYVSHPKSKIQRTFMPKAGPAAIAISLNKNLHLCWDAGTCQFRYAWSGQYIDTWPVLRGNGNGLAKILGETFVNLEQGNPFNQNASLRFKGYSIQNNQPILRYTLDGEEVEITFEATPKNELKIHYRCQFKSSQLFSPKLTIGHWSSNKGKLKDGQLKLTPEESRHFIITFKAGEDS